MIILRNCRTMPMQQQANAAASQGKQAKAALCQGSPLPR